MSSAPVLVWLRQDLRLADNPALVAAAESGRPVLCLYILDDGTPGRWRLGGASRWWLHGSLENFRQALQSIGGRLLLRRGAAEMVLDAVIADSRAEAVFWNRCYEPFAVARDKALKARLAARGLEVQSFNAALLAEPWEMATGSGTPYRVFTPFWKALRQREIARPLPAPKRLEPFGATLEGDDLDDWGLRPTRPDWAGGLRQVWTPGEAAARQRLEAFLGKVAEYREARDQPSLEATSRLSPHLHFGEISPRTIWHAVRHAVANEDDKFLSELTWREFCHHLLFHNPQLPEAVLDAKFADFPWTEDEAGYRAWCAGRTGIPIVDAGMRELWQTGWMHNRVRMIAASFLVKHQMIDWRRGEDWFWDTLADADLANNAAGWQWVAGCGADAAPFFRIFNPVLQGEKFDADGAYVRRFVPELAKLPDKYLHKPWAAPGAVLAKAGVRLGDNYPKPIVDLAEGRKRALAAFKDLKARN